MGQIRTSARGRIRRLVRIVRGLQRDEQLSTEEMARRLGISASMLGMVYNGHRSPGRKFLHGLLKAYPRLREEVLLFLLQDMINSE
nr:helix-turn-helix transcriptional regulator [Chloroflexota bacterium]